MMTNLFSSFDPSSSLTISWMNWLSSLIVLMIPSLYWSIPSKIQLFFIKITQYIVSEFSSLIKFKEKLGIIVYVNLFMFILINNFMGLFPYIFTSTSHVSVSLSFSLLMWVSLMLYNVFYNTYMTLAHLVPQGTPWPLMSFMVLIETISNIIRPLSLCVRLSANMIAGHLLLTLLGSIFHSLDFNSMMILGFVQIILLLLEMAVSVIQSYVFSVLITLYSAENSYETIS